MGPVLYIFDNDTYRRTLYELPESVNELRRAFLFGESSDRFDAATEKVSFVVNGPPALSAMISERYGSSSVHNLEDLPLARHLPAQNDRRVVAHALSRWEEGDP
jgi:hypothetical protein